MSFLIRGACGAPNRHNMLSRQSLCGAAAFPPRGASMWNECCTGMSLLIRGACGAASLPIHVWPAEIYHASAGQHRCSLYVQELFGFARKPTNQVFFRMRCSHTEIQFE